VAELKDNEVVQLHHLICAKLAQAEEAAAAIRGDMDRSDAASYQERRTAFETKWRKCREESWRCIQAVGEQLFGPHFVATTAAEEAFDQAK